MYNRIACILGVIGLAAWMAHKGYSAQDIAACTSATGMLVASYVGVKGKGTTS